MKWYSYSKIAKRLQCRYKAYLHYEKGLRVRRVADPLARGTLIHMGMEAAINAAEKSLRGSEVHDSVLHAFDEYKKNLPENIEFPTQFMNECAQLTNAAVQELEIDRGRWETLEIAGERAVEMHIEKVHERGWGFHGYMDWVARDTKTGHIWLMDFKTSKSIKQPDKWDQEWQTALYAHILRTTYDTDIRGGNIMQIRSHWPKTKKAQEQLCKPVWLYRTPEYCERVWDMVAREIQFLEAVEETMPPTPNLGTLYCGFCEFKDYCQETLRGGDLEHLEKTQFMKKGEKPVEITLEKE